MSSFWTGKRVLVTGHTGFKGGWLSTWLSHLGAEVWGLSLAPDTKPSLFEGLDLDLGSRHVEGDIRDAETLRRVFAEARPDVVFHVAAQALVTRSYDDPAGTFSTNVLGTVNLLEAARSSALPMATVVVTSDKCYENREWVWPYRETDPVGGHDPYSASKGCAELVVSSYRRSFFGSGEKTPMGLASARAGNVIGGGDWAARRIVPDFVRAALNGDRLHLRSPDAVRPWQHVLEPLSGYLCLAERLCQDPDTYSEAWNFGPADDEAKPVAWLVERLGAAWGTPVAVSFGRDEQVHESRILRLDCSKARSRLGWRPRLTLERALSWTAEWYQAFSRGERPGKLVRSQIERYEAMTPEPSALAIS